MPGSMVSGDVAAAAAAAPPAEADDGMAASGGSSLAVDDADMDSILSISRKLVDMSGKPAGISGDMLMRALSISERLAADDARERTLRSSPRRPGRSVRSEKPRVMGSGGGRRDAGDGRRFGILALRDVRARSR